MMSDIEQTTIPGLTTPYPLFLEYVIIGGAALLAVLLLVAIGCCCFYCQSRRAKNRLAANQKTTQSKKENADRKSKRGSAEGPSNISAERPAKPHPAPAEAKRDESQEPELILNVINPKEYNSAITMSVTDNQKTPGNWLTPSRRNLFPGGGSQAPLGTAGQYPINPTLILTATAVQGVYKATAAFQKPSLQTRGDRSSSILARQQKVLPQAQTDGMPAYFQLMDHQGQMFHSGGAINIRPHAPSQEYSVGDKQKGSIMSDMSSAVSV